MPYKNIVFIQLEKRLFNDPRWYMMSDNGQLTYIRLLLFAAETYNKVPKDLEILKKAFKTDQDIKIIESGIKEVQNNFPKFKQTKHFYYFDGFEEKTNYRHQKGFPKELLGKTKGQKKEGVYRYIYKYKYIYKEETTKLIKIWNSYNTLPQILSLGNKRKEKLGARFKEQYFKENYEKAIKKMAESKFCTGGNDRGWKVTIDWFIDNDNNYIKVLEGKYDDGDEFVKKYAQ